jgi:hypothetical protein
VLVDAGICTLLRNNAGQCSRSGNEEENDALVDIQFTKSGGGGETRMSNSQWKAMKIIFFDIRGITMIEGYLRINQLS